MSSKDVRGDARRPIEPLFAGAENDAQGENWDDWDEFEPGPSPDDIWDAFESDDELPEPQPEYGDFWGELDDEELT